ncbi:MAG: hypothetical protein HKP04_03650 [Flavobacteriaceae bacterium]|nr:hypothetical protein [Flavobacteriaceae bacterium]
MFLLLFLGVKASAFHPLTHQESEEPVPCEFCTLVIQQELEDFDHPEVQHVPDEVLQPDVEKEQASYFSTPYLRDIWKKYFSRPPPQLA